MTFRSSYQTEPDGELKAAAEGAVARNSLKIMSSDERNTCFHAPNENRWPCRQQASSITCMARNWSCTNVSNWVAGKPKCPGDMQKRDYSGYTVTCGGAAELPIVPARPASAWIQGRSAGLNCELPEASTLNERLSLVRVSCASSNVADAVSASIDGGLRFIDKLQN